MNENSLSDWNVKLYLSRVLSNSKTVRDWIKYATNLWHPCTKKEKKKGRRFRSIELINDETIKPPLPRQNERKKQKKKDKRRKMIFRMHTTLYETLDWYPIKALFSLSEIALHLSLFHWFSNLGWKMKKKRKYDALLFFYIVTKYYPLFFPFFFWNIIFPFFQVLYFQI